MAQSQIEPMELKRRELIQQIYNARRLLRDIHIGFKLSIEVSIEGNLWVYAQSVKSQFAITWHPEERLHTMIGELVHEDYGMRSWTAEEKELGFAVRLKVPSVIRKFPQDVWPVI